MSPGEKLTFHSSVVVRSRGKVEILVKVMIFFKLSTSKFRVQPSKINIVTAFSSLFKLCLAESEVVHHSIMLMVKLF